MSHLIKNYAVCKFSYIGLWKASSEKGGKHKIIEFLPLQVYPFTLKLFIRTILALTELLQFRF